MNLPIQALSDSSYCLHCPQAGRRRWTTWDAPTMSTITTAQHSGKGPPTCMLNVFPLIPNAFFALVIKKNKIKKRLSLETNRGDDNILIDIMS